MNYFIDILKAKFLNNTVSLTDLKYCKDGNINSLK